TRRVCPGYTEGLDLVLRCQNQVAKAGAERRHKHLQPRRSGSPESILSNRSSSSPTSLVIYTPLPESQDFYAHAFFVSCYVKARRDPRTEHGFLELLPSFFDKLPSSSAFSLSLSAVAHCYFGAWEPAIRDAERTEVQNLYIKALRALQLALRDPQECVSDEILVAVCLLAFLEDTISALMSRTRMEDHVKGATALIKQRRSSTMKSDLSKRLLIAVRHHIITNALATGMHVQEVSEVWQDPEQLPSNPATLLDAMSLQAANVLAAAAKHANSKPSDKVRSDLLLRARTVASRLEIWPSLVPQEWWPVSFARESIPQEIAEAGLHGDHCDMYHDTSVCDTWLTWRSTCLRVFALIADYEQGEAKSDAVLQLQQTVDDIFAAVPFMLGSKSQMVPLHHYHSAAAFGGLTLWPPLKTIMDHVRHLRSNQILFLGQQIKRIGTLYDVRNPDRGSSHRGGSP
ncbi:MAG: hypothetical protein LQ341_003578, partial [Variospora aurantia]